MNAFSPQRPLSYVTYRHLFMRALFPLMAHIPYVLLKRHYLPISTLANNDSLDILTAKDMVEDWTNLCSFSAYVNRLKVTDKGRETHLKIYFSDNSTLTLRLVHSLSYVGLTWVDVEAVLGQALINREGIKIADTQFYLEYTYLSAVLSRKPVDNEQVYYFCDQSPLVQAQLLGQFKQRYPVKANSLAELFACTFQHRRRVVSILESLPHNRWRTRVRQMAKQSWRRFWVMPVMQRATRLATGMR